MVETVSRHATFEVSEWLPEDTEESVMGTQWHQEAIDALATMIVEVGRRHGSGWSVARGISLLDTGARYASGRSYDPKPDVMTLARPLPAGDIAGVSLADVSVPLFICEVASRSTLGNDIAFKKDVYEYVGVQEYIVFDAAGGLIAPALHAWRRDKAGYVPWVADDDGWWRSQALHISFQPTQPFMTVRDRDGRQLSLPSRAYEREARLDRLEEELSDARRRIAEMEDQLRRPRE